MVLCAHNYVHWQASTRVLRRSTSLDLILCSSYPDKITTGEAKFPECRRLPRVPKIGHLPEPTFPECCTRGRAALGKEKCYLTAQPAHAVKTKKKLLCRVSHPGTRQGGWLPRVPCHGTRQRASLPSAREGTRGKKF